MRDGSVWKILVTLPDDVEFEEAGNPLDRHPTWKHVDCSVLRPALRYVRPIHSILFPNLHGISPVCRKRPRAAFFRRIGDYWLAVNGYIGGIEHAILHLAIPRFFHASLAGLRLFKRERTVCWVIDPGHGLSRDIPGSGWHGAGWLFPEEVSKTADGI